MAMSKMFMADNSKAVLGIRIVVNESGLRS
jgi:hypothetical protein